jgi:hypothetical protein
MTWAIAGVATILVVGIVTVAVANVGKGRGGTGGGSAQGARPAATATPSPEAVDALRSHMPADLRSMAECQKADPGTNAEAAIECRWPSSQIPMVAMYRSYTDIDSMNLDAEALHHGDNPAQSCASADDFTNGGKTTWTEDGREGGTVWCYRNEVDGPVVLWTDEALHILAVASASAIDGWQQLLDWMRQQGSPR